MGSVSRNVLILNGGSSSIKFAMYSMEEDLEKIFSGQISKIGLDGSEFKIAGNDQ